MSASYAGATEVRTDHAPPTIHLRPHGSSIDAIDLTTNGTPSASFTRTIPIAAAVGEGSTALAAFDHALRLTGIANYNLVRLSSVIPPASRIAPTDQPVQPGGTWGDRLYVVYASQPAVEPGDEAWAGVAWVQDPSDHRGLFVEHEGVTEQDVRRDLVNTLSDMTDGRPGNWTEPELVVTGGTVVDRPICAFVVAAYEHAPWNADLQVTYAL
jgi:arginine decarboxylase